MTERSKPRVETHVVGIGRVAVIPVQRELTVEPQAEARSHTRWWQRVIGRGAGARTTTADSTIAPERPQRLVLALGATGERAKSWDRAQQAHSALFRSIADGRRVAVGLACYSDWRGLRTWPFTTEPRAVERAMRRIRCGDGRQRIGDVLAHAIRCARQRDGLRALVLIADCIIEEWREESRLVRQGRRLTGLGTRTFIIHDDTGCSCERRFGELAAQIGGTCTGLESGTPGELAALLDAIGAYAGGGVEAMRARGTAAGEGRATVERLMRQVERLDR